MEMPQVYSLVTAGRLPRPLPLRGLGRPPRASRSVAVISSAGAGRANR